MLRSIRSRLILSYLFVILLAMGIAAGLAWNALDRAFLDVLRENLLAQAQRVAQTVEAGDLSALGLDAESGPYNQTSNLVAGYHTRVIDDEGVILLGSSSAGEVGGSDPPSLSTDSELRTNLGLPPLDLDLRSRTYSEELPLMSRPEVQSALRGEPATAVRAYAWAPGRRVLYGAYPVRAPDGTVISVAYVASPLPRLALSLLPATFGAEIVGGAALAVGLAGLVGLLLARQLTRPLRRLTQAASTLARGDPPPRIPPTRTAELDTLGSAFNTMSERLTAAHAELAAQFDQREAILHGLADAVLAVDETGRVILTNPAASTLLEGAPARLQEELARSLELGAPHQVEITVRGRVIELLITPLFAGEALRGAVAVGHDITPHRQLDRLRTHFVSDVSHELRTPLTAIKGFVETLQDGAAEEPDVRDRFLGTIAGETERLIRLTNDLLLLTRSDAGRLDLRLAPTDLAAAARQAVAALEAQAAEKGLDVTVDTPGDLPSVAADADRMHQVLVNLLDNGIKFTPAGGRIVLSLRSGEGEVVCAVSDSGPGIPATELPHLFERFYRGDPSRVRGEGQGAGLGLAIARAIVEAHGGRIWAESAPGRGAKITLTLPVDKAHGFTRIEAD